MAGADAGDYLDASAVAALSGGAFTVEKVRYDMRRGYLRTESLPEFGSRSPRRARRGDALTWIARNGVQAIEQQSVDDRGRDRAHGDDHLDEVPSATEIDDTTTLPRDAARLDDDGDSKLLDTTLAVKASLAETVDALVEEARARVALAQAQLQSEQAHLKTLEHLRTAIAGLNSALTPHIVPG